MPDNKDLLLIDESYEPQITEAEARALKPIMKAFVADYLKNRNKMSVDEWLETALSGYLPRRDPQEIKQMTANILTTVHTQEEKLDSVRKAAANGRSKESWFASEAKKATSHLSNQEAAKYLEMLDGTLATANDALYRTIHTQAGAISQNSNLDGFIAEQYHAQTFNLDAAAKGSQYRAEVLEPNGHGYAKNSVDIVIKDGNGKIVRRYQSKYCKNAQATEHAFEQGDYRGQRKLVPSEQADEIRNGGTKVSDRITAPDGTSSKPLEKPSAKELQEQAQSGKWNDLNWNEYHMADLAKGIGKQAGQAALMGAAIGVGFDVAQKVWNGEEIEGEEVVMTAITSGADFGVKAAVSGAVKVGVEKGFIKMIPKGTPAATIANIVHVGVENVKVIGRMAKGELSAEEGFDRMEQVTVSAVAGIATSAKGMAIGAEIGTVFGPIGMAVGGFVGGTVGYMAGSSVGESVVKQMQTIRKKVYEIAVRVGDKAREAVGAVADGIRNFVGLFA